MPLVLVKSKVLEENLDCGTLVDLNDSSEGQCRNLSTSVNLVKFVQRSVQETKARVVVKTRRKKAKSLLYKIADESVDPLEWNGTVEWHWFTGFVIYVIIFILPLVIGFTSSQILQISNTNDNPSSWYKCGIYCAFIWWFLINCYNFVFLRAIVRLRPLFLLFNPSWRMAL